MAKDHVPFSFIVHIYLVAFTIRIWILHVHLHDLFEEFTIFLCICSVVDTSTNNGRVIERTDAYTTGYDNNTYTFTTPIPVTESIELKTDNIVILDVTPMIRPYAGGTNITVKLRCPPSGCGDVTLTIGEERCINLQEQTCVANYTYYTLAIKFTKRFVC